MRIKQRDQTKKGAQSVNPNRIRSNDREQSSRRDEYRPLRSLQRSLGNQSIQQLIEQETLPTTCIGHPRSKEERKADQIAETIRHFPDSSTSEKTNEEVSPFQMGRQDLRHQKPFIQRHSRNSPDREEPLQRIPSEAPSTVVGLERELRLSRNGGQPLPESVRSFFEPYFGQDFGDVRVHTDGRTAGLTRALNARAFTYGRDIYFSPGSFRPKDSAGQQLLAHELTHTVQQSETQPFVQRQLFTPLGPGGGFRGLLERDRRRSEQDRRRSAQPSEATSQQSSTQGREESIGSEPDISYRGYYTFFLPTLAQSGRENGFRVQFSSPDTSSRTVSIKISYQGTNHLREFTFSQGVEDTLTPRLINQDISAAAFDTNGDGQADVEVFLSAEPSSPAIEVLVTRPGITLGAYTIPPPRRQIVPNRGYLMGTLPNGKQYYLQPWTYHLPHGPLFVDEDGVLVNPGLESSAAATLSAAGRTYLYSYAVLAAIALGRIPITSLGGIGVIRWLFSGTRLIAGGTGAASNLATQALEHGENWSQYNWGSVGFDYVMGAVSYSFAKTVIRRWPAQLFSREIKHLRTWVNFGKQQSVLTLYGTLVGAVRAYISNTPTGATVGAQHAEGLLQAFKSIALQSFLASPLGRRLFPSGFDDPKVVFLSRTLTFVLKLAVREAFDVTPQSEARRE